MRATTTNPAADTAALERHAYELFTQAAQDRTTASSTARHARLQEAALNPARLERAAAPQPHVPLGFQLWLAYLLWLEAALDTLAASWKNVTSAELAGLLALARARARFLRDHQTCPRCETLNPRHARRCRRCSQEF